MKLAAIYARVSTARQEEEQTIKTQMVGIHELIQKRDLKLVAEYLDEGWSGDILARPALDRLRQEAKQKLWQILVVYDPDRLARRYSYQELVMDELKEAGIEVVFVTVSVPQNSDEKILYGVRGLFAEYERVKIGERFRLGKLRKIKEGHILVSEPLYGYRYIPKKERIHGYYEINKEEARIVTMIFDWVDQDGLTLRKVVRKLQTLGIKPRKSKRGVWATSTLSHLLRNKAYIGEARWGSSYAVVPEHPKNRDKYRKIRKSSRRIRPEHEWFVVPVPAVIEREVFTRVQEKLKAHFILSRRNTKNEYLLAGKIHCICGRRRGGEGPLHGKHLYYRCLDRVLNFPLPRVCKEKAINARIVDDLVWNGITSLMTSPALMQKQIQVWKDNQRDNLNSSGRETEIMKTEIAKLRDQADRYNKAYASGLLTLEQLKGYINPVRAQVVAYEAEIFKSEQERRELRTTPLPDQNEVVVFAKEASQALQNLNFETKRAIVMNVVERVVGTKDSLQVEGLLPLTNINVFTIHRHGQSIPQHGFDENGPKIVPFRLKIAIPRHLVEKNAN